MSNVVLFPMSQAHKNGVLREYYDNLLHEAEMACLEIRQISAMNPEWAMECLEDLTAIAEHINSAAFGGQLRIERKTK